MIPVPHVSTLKTQYNQNCAPTRKYDILNMPREHRADGCRCQRESRREADGSHALFWSDLPASWYI